MGGTKQDRCDIWYSNCGYSTGSGEKLGRLLFKRDRRHQRRKDDDGIGRGRRPQRNGKKRNKSTLPGAKNS
jgi:hypothetical protein